MTSDDSPGDSSQTKIARLNVTKDSTSTLSNTRHQNAVLGPDPARQDALDRVDGFLRALAADKLLQDDLRHPDVRRAIRHWTGNERLSQDEADELMEDNYRINAVFDKIAALQGYCKAAGIGFPLAEVLFGTGLHPEIATGEKTPRQDEQNASASATGRVASNERSSNVRQASTSEVRKRSADQSGNRLENRSAGPAPVQVPLGDKGEQEGEISWLQAAVEALLKIVAACVSAVLFAQALRYFRGDNPLRLPDEVIGGDDRSVGEEF